MGVFIVGDEVGATPTPRQRSMCSFFSTVGRNRPWNRHMMNGWEFQSHVHHGDVGGSEPTQGGPTSQVGRSTPASMWAPPTF